MNESAAVADLSCPKQARCPGCPLGALPYTHGLASKGRGLEGALAPYSGLQPELLEPRAASPTLAYRLRAKLVIDGQALGLFARGSHRVVDISGCRVLSPALTRAAVALRKRLPLPLHGADLRESSEGVLVSLLTEAVGARAELERTARELVEEGAALSVAISVRRPGELRLLSGEPQVVVGPSAARHALSEGSPYGYAAHGGFVQAHAGQASYVYEEIARGLREGLPDNAAPTVLELFAGNGSLALGLARTGARVTAVEAYAPAIALAERAASEQGLTLRAVASDASRFARQEPARYDAIVVNPPRRGLSVELRDAIGRAAPRTLAYVSCNPHTLARDAWHLQQLGLSLERAEPLDMIPWSDAIEALCWFRAAPPPPARVVFENAAYLALDQAPYAPPPVGVIALATWQPAPSVSGVRWFAKHEAAAASVGNGAAEHELTVLTRGNLRKQGTVMRRSGPAAAPGVRYFKQAELGRHSLLRLLTRDSDEQGALRDLASIRHPVLGDAQHGDPASNEFLEHRHGLDRAFIHCGRSTLHLANGSAVEASAQLAPDLSRVLASLRSD